MPAIRFLRLQSLIPLLLLLAIAGPADCWWETGHRAIARIAAVHLTPATRTHLARLLDVSDTEAAVADALAAGSTWADEVKADTHTGEWHFIDLTLQDGKSDIPTRCKDDNCVSARIRLFAVQLASQTPVASARWSNLDALRFLVHFVGDVHQPLHAISDADLGGNCEVLDPPVMEAKNLHALWDGGIVNSLGAGDRKLAANLEGYLTKLGEENVRAWTLGSVDDWVWESHLLAQSNVYAKLHIPIEPVTFPFGCKEAPSEIVNFKPQVDALYIDSMKPVVRDQLAKAGLRLARLLNETLL